MSHVMSQLWPLQGTRRDMTRDMTAVQICGSPARATTTVAAREEGRRPDDTCPHPTTMASHHPQPAAPPFLERADARRLDAWTSPTAYWSSRSNSAS